VNTEVGYPLAGSDCGCRRIMDESCWGGSRLLRIEFCEKHCPQCQYYREHPEREELRDSPIIRELRAHNPIWHASRAE